MPLYDFQCRRCGDHPTEHFVPLADFDKPGPQCSFCGGSKERLISAPQIVTDIQPYQAMGVDIATGKAPVITSRSQHRDYLKRNGYVEVGNEKPRTADRPEISDKDVARDVKKTIEKTGVRL
jgi:putative FmdB family regulatory protein